MTYIHENHPNHQSCTPYSNAKMMDRLGMYSSSMGTTQASGFGTSYSSSPKLKGPKVDLSSFSIM